MVYKFYFLKKSNMFHKLCKYTFHNMCMGIWHFEGIDIAILRRTEHISQIV